MACVRLASLRLACNLFPLFFLVSCKFIFAFTRFIEFRNLRKVRSIGDMVSCLLALVMSRLFSHLTTSKPYYYLSICLTASVSHCLLSASLSVSISHCLSLCLSVCLSLCLSLPPPPPPHTHTHFSIVNYLFIYVSVYPCIYPISHINTNFYLRRQLGEKGKRQKRKQQQQLQ